MRSFWSCLGASIAAGVTVAGVSGAATMDAAAAAQPAAAGLAAAEPAAASGGVGRAELLRLGFQLVNLNSRRCLTVTAGGLDDNAILIQGDCERDASYRWRFVPVEYTGMVLIENVGSGKCLTIAGASNEDNVFATQLECDSDPARQWRVRRPAGALLSVPVGDAMLENGRSHKCLTIAGGSAAENGVAVQYRCDTERSRRWSIRLVAGPALA